MYFSFHTSNISASFYKIEPMEVSIDVTLTMYEYMRSADVLQFQARPHLQKQFFFPWLVFEAYVNSILNWFCGTRSLIVPGNSISLISFTATLELSPFFPS